MAEASKTQTQNRTSAPDDDVVEASKAPGKDANVETWAKFAADKGVVVSSHVGVPDIVAALRESGIVVDVVQDRDVDGDRTQDGAPQPAGDETVDADNEVDEPRERKEVKRTEAGGAVNL